MTSAVVEKTEYAKEEKPRKRLKAVEYFDYATVMIVVFLLGFGMVMLYSASSYTAAMRWGSASYFLKKQFIISLAGLFFMYIVSKMDYHWIDSLSPVIYIIAVVLCLYVIFNGDSENNSARWIYLGPIGFQPSEAGKVATILYSAHIISGTSFIKRSAEERVKTLLKAGWPLMIVAGEVAVTNLSTGLIILLIAAGMLFIAYPKAKIFAVMGGVVAAVGLIFIKAQSYRSGRIQAWLHPEDYTNGTFQTLQGLYAIGSGGLFGKGLGQSLQKKFVPYAQNDMIFSLVCEELGLFGAVCVIILYLLLLWRIFTIAMNAKDKLGSYIAIGVMIHIALQVILHIAVTTNSMPNTGVTLPFISYGGSSVVMLLAEIGLVLNVSRSIDFSA